MSTKTKQQSKPSALRHLRASDLRGAARLATEGTQGLTRVVEGMHQSVWRRLGAPAGEVPGRARGLTGLAYRTVHGLTGLVGAGVERSLSLLEPLIESGQPVDADSPERAAVLAALNGVIGDRLAASANPLATRMSLRRAGAAIDPDALSAAPRHLLLIHGLCMNDLQWRREGHDHGVALAASLGIAPVYLRYNTGRPIAENGRELALLLEQALGTRAGEQLDVLAHSMGGLLIRHAVHSARQLGLHWPDRLQRIVFLGTPHQGAPLEKAGNWVELLLGSMSYTAPLAKLAKVRSAGITDLRHGLDAQVQPLPEGIACFSYAATLAARRGALADRLLGDGLVPLASALGQHADPELGLAFAKERQAIGYSMGHLELLSRPEVTVQLQEWLA
ncbi:esterase/lipase family protein [Paucibacter sp. JuS9]|uniref:esterase/lipase family protein n=1 Tax=Roseateles TaxID=93681 RepID=UPI002FE55DEF